MNEGMPFSGSLTQGFCGGSLVKNVPVMKETWVRFLGEEDHLAEEMVTHSTIFARKILWIEEPGGLQSVESQRVRHTDTQATDSWKSLKLPFP